MLETTMAFHVTDGVNDLNVCTLCGNHLGPKQGGTSMEHSENFNVEFLDDFDTMMEDVDNKLRISRMVSDSVIKGIVSAVEQETNEKIKAKDMEIASLKRSRSFLNVNVDQIESTSDFKGYASFEDACVEYDTMKDTATDEFKRLRKQIEGVRGCKIKRNGSCYEMVGLSGILNEEYDMEKTVDSLEMMMGNMCKLVDTVFMFSKTSLNEWQHERQLKEELEDKVIQSSIKCIQEELQEAGSQNLVLAEKFSNISDLRNEIESLGKLLPTSDSGHLISHGSFDVDNTHGNPLRSQLSTRWEENWESKESNLDVPDSFDTNSLSHLTREGLVKFFNDLILKKKREHEAEVHELADKYISLKGKYLSEKRSFVLPTKDLEVLKKKIPEVVSKLDGILSESDEFIKKGDNVASINTFLGENCQLRDSLAVMKDEVNHLSSQLSIVSENHKSFMADAFIELFIVEDVYNCVIWELNLQIQDVKEESNLEIVAMQDVYQVLLENSGVCAIEDTFTESLFTQELLETVFKETLVAVKQKLETLHEKYTTTCENLVSIEKKATGMEFLLISETEERERLTNEVGLLRNLMAEKEALAKNELNNLRKQASLQETMMSKTSEELDEMNDKLSKAKEIIISDEMEITSLKQKLALAMEEIKTSNDYKNMVLDLSLEKERFTSFFEAKEKDHRKQMEAIVVLVDELSTKLHGFECRVTMDILDSNTRLENLKSQLSSLTKAANLLKSTGFIYKQKFERKCADLQMAEDEVDLLGDEVDTLLGLLEKIYVALDHYSPVLQHYSGVIEILKLVRREITGESLRAP